MNLRAVAWLLGCAVLLIAGFLLVPAAIGLGYGESGTVRACLLSALASALPGSALVGFNRGSAVSADGRLDYFRREGLAVVGLTWLAAGALGALPYLFSGVLRSPIDAFFESASGFTTTGSTVLSGDAIDGLPHGIAFWRSFTHWLGGIGIVMVFVVLFPTGGRSLFRSEVPGIAREASRQRVRDSALALVKIYVVLTAVQVALLLAAGLGLVRRGDPRLRDAGDRRLLEPLHQRGPLRVVGGRADHHRVHVRRRAELRHLRQRAATGATPGLAAGRRLDRGALVHGHGRDLDHRHRPGAVVLGRQQRRRGRRTCRTTRTSCWPCATAPSRSSRCRPAPATARRTSTAGPSSAASC